MATIGVTDSGGGQHHHRHRSSTTSTDTSGGGGGGGGGTYDAAVRGSIIRTIIEVARQHNIPPGLALAVAFHESGLDPRQSGDHGYFDANGNFIFDNSSPPTSFGLFQLHERGQLGNLTPQQAYDPRTNAEVAISHIAAVYHQHPDWTWGQVAAASQGPADKASYTQTIDSIANDLQSSGKRPAEYFASQAPAAAASGGGANFQGSGGGGAAAGGGAGSPRFSRSDLVKRYGYLAQELDNHQLQQLVQKAVDRRWGDDQFLAHLRNTDWYQNHTQAQRTWFLNTVSKGHAEIQNEIATQRQAIAAQAQSMGVNLDHLDLQHLALASLRNAWTPDQLSRAIADHFEYRQNHLSGMAAQNQQSFMQMADQYGLPLSQQTMDTWVQKSLTDPNFGSTVQDQLKQQAISMYPALQKDIEAGRTVADVAATYRDTMANLLEQDASGLSWRDPMIRKALQYQPDPSKPQELMPIYQFENMVRQDPRWLNTNNAKQSVLDTGIGVLQDMGLAS